MTTAEVFELVLAEIEKPGWGGVCHTRRGSILVDGICGTLKVLWGHYNKISLSERSGALEHMVKTKRIKEYWWPEGEKEPRINWLKEQIEKLKQ